MFRQEKKNGSNNLVVECALEKISGGAQTVMGKFNGMPTATIPPGGWIMSDPFYPSQFGLSEFPANWDARCRTGSTIATGQKWPFNAYQQYETISGQANCLSDALVSQIAATGALVTPAGGLSNSTTGLAAYGPVAIVGEWVATPDVSLMISGDSIVSKLNDSDDNGSTGGAFITRGVRSVNGRSIANVKVAKGGELASNWSAGNAFRKYLMSFCTHYIDNFGTNDLNGQTAAAALTSKQAIWADFRALAKGPKWIVNIPVTPKANSTDSWATLANQTPLSGFNTGEKRDTLNASIVSLVGTSTGPDQVIDVNTVWQDGTQTAKWVVNGTANYPTADNVHPSAALHSLGGTVIASGASSWTA